MFHLKKKKIGQFVVFKLGKEKSIINSCICYWINYAWLASNDSIFQLVIGGPFIPSIECILRRKASSMSSPVVSTSDPGNRSALRGFCEVSGVPRQLCDIVLQIEKDFDLVYTDLHLLFIYDKLDFLKLVQCLTT